MSNTINVDLTYSCSHCARLMNSFEGLDGKQYLQCLDGDCENGFRPAPKPHAYVTILPHGAVLSVK
jgi:hypothetical protein